MLDGVERRISTEDHASPSAQRKALRLAPTGRSSLLVVANANASGLEGKRDTVDRAASLLRGLGARVESRWTASPAELEQLISEEERRVVLIGGDGTLQAVANIRGHKPEIALLPRGRANNIARALGVPPDLTWSAKLAVQGIAHPIDGISVETPELKMIALEKELEGLQQEVAKLRASASG